MDNVYKTGQDRQQSLLFPPSLDEVIPKNNPVRGIDSYVDILDVFDLGFDNKTSTAADGASAFHPALLLKIYIYGYTNKIRSSRSLEKEIKRNIEMMWLCKGLTPSHTTIANFRKNNAKALKNVFKEFVLLCRNLDLIGNELVALDGAFLRANASKNQLLMHSTIVKDLDKITLKIEDYLTQLDTIDQQNNKSDLTINATELIAKTNQLKDKKSQLEQEKVFLEQHNKKQYNKTDPDASLMQKPAHNLMAYNSQIVVDDKYKLIVATDITSCGTDINQLHKMAKQTKAILATDSLTIVADTGYDNHQQIKQCYDDGITPIIPGRNLAKVQQKKGKFSRDKFVYNADIDNYICPNNKILTKQNQPQIKPNGKVNFGYATSRKDCKQCPLKSQCLPDKTLMKRIYRWEHQAMLDKHYDKMQTKEVKTTIKRRGSIVEHPFGTIKRLLGWDHYLVRGKEKVSGENALIMFSYNFKRVINILGVTGFIAMTLTLETWSIDTFLVNFWQNFIFSGLFIVILLNVVNSLNIKQNRRYLSGRYLKIVICGD